MQTQDEILVARALTAADEAYRQFLRLPNGRARLDAQKAMCLLRDLIGDIMGIESQEVQDIYEERRLLEG